MRMNKFLSAVCVAALMSAAIVPAEAQTFDPLSKSLGGVVTGSVLYAGPVPAVTGTGSPTITAASTNVSGLVTAGTSATSIVITFGGIGFTGAAPSCLVQSQTQLAAFSYVVTQLTITITQTATSGNKINYRCDPQA